MSSPKPTLIAGKIRCSRCSSKGSHQEKIGDIRFAMFIVKYEKLGKTALFLCHHCKAWYDSFFLANSIPLEVKWKAMEKDGYRAYFIPSESSISAQNATEAQDPPEESHSEEESSSEKGYNKH